MKGNGHMHVFHVWLSFMFGFFFFILTTVMIMMMFDDDDDDGLSTSVNPMYYCGCVSRQRGEVGGCVSRQRGAVC